MADSVATHDNNWKDFQDMVKEFQELRFVPEKDSYQATKEETWEAYQALITIVESQSKVSLPRDVLCRVADEVLWVLKSRIFSSPSEKKAEIERILNPLPYFIYNQLVSTAKLITDYNNRVAAEALAATEKDFYQPRLEETWVAYKSLLDLVCEQFDYEQPQVVLCILAHEILVTLKDGSIDNWKKREMITNTLKDISNQSFDALLCIGERITDFNSSGYEVGENDYINNPTQEQVCPGFYYDFTLDDEEGMEFQYDLHGKGFCEADGYVMDPKSDSDVGELVADSGAESGSGTDDELLSLGFEKVRVSDKEVRDDWVMIDF